MGNHHHHHHHHHHDSSKNIGFALLLNLGFAIIELIGGLYFQSVAIVADAIHDFGDAGSLGVAYLLERLSKKPSDQKFSYGYKRLSLLGALITGTILVGGCVFVLYEALPRLSNPVLPNANGMMLFAVFGIAVNGYGAWRLSAGNTLNEKVLSWHLIEDLAGWVLVLIGGALIKWTGLAIIDPILSIIFTGMILLGVYRVLKQTLHVFLQGTPSEVDLGKIKTEIESLELIDNVHDIHVWSLDGESHVLTLHLAIKEHASLPEIDRAKNDARNIIKKYGKFHTTIETETDTYSCPKQGCSQL